MLILEIVSYLFYVYMIMLFVRILGSWIPELAQSRFMQFLSFYTDPYLNVFRKIIPPLGMIDISPIVAFIVLGIFEKLALQLVAMLVL